MSHRSRWFLALLGAVALILPAAMVRAAYHSPWQTDTLQFKKGGGKGKGSKSSSSSGASTSSGDTSSTPSSTDSSSSSAAASSTPATPPAPVNTQALATLHDLYDKLEKEWEATPDAAALLQDQKNAQEAYDTAVQTVTDQVSHTPEYQVAVDQQKALADHLEQVKASSPGARSDIDAATNDLTTASLALHKMETDARSKDEHVLQTKAALLKAQLAVATAKDVWEKSLSQNPEYVAAAQAAGQPVAAQAAPTAASASDAAPAPETAPAP